MNQGNCFCEFKGNMMDSLRAMQESAPGKETQWVTHLLGDGSDKSICCLLLFLFYYGYCKECTSPLSEEARRILAPLMQPQPAE